MEQPRVRVLEIFFLLVLVALTVAFYQVMHPFILNIFLAAIFTSILRPTHDRLTKILRGNRAIASLLIIIMVLVIVAVPVTLVAILVYAEAVSGYAAFTARLPELSVRLSQVSILDWVRDLPFFGEYIGNVDSIDLSQLLRQAVSAGSNFILTTTQRSFVSVAAALANFLLVLILMYFFLYGGRQMTAAVFKIIPLPNRELQEIIIETRRTSSATLISTLLIGIIEGSFGAVIFLIFGVPSPFLWGVIMMILSMIPLIGTNLVLVPAGIILIATGRLFAGIAVVALGVAGVATTQNVIKPKLLGDRSGLHPALALLATIGGIAWIGLIGFLVGPLVAALFLVVWRQFEKRYERELATRDVEKDEATESTDSRE